MAETGRVRWQSPPPTSIDEELVVYDDGSAYLIVRTARDRSPVIGTWRAGVDDADLAVLAGLMGQQRTVDLRHHELDPVLYAAERIAAAARDSPVATATFYASSLPDGEVALLAVGGGTGPADFQLDPDSVLVHLEQADGTEVGWHPMQRLETGFVSPEPQGLGGVGRPAEITPGAYGAIALAGPAIERGQGISVAVEVTGRLHDALPEQPSDEHFRVRTTAVPLPD